MSSKSEVNQIIATELVLANQKVAKLRATLEWLKYFIEAKTVIELIDKTLDETNGREGN